MPFDLSVVGQASRPHAFRYGAKDAALYALACGATEAELDLVLESRGPVVLPTFSVVLALPAVSELIARLGGNILMLVHGAQRCRVPRSLPPEAEVDTTARLDALYDKGKAALAIYRTESKDSAGKLLAETEWQIFYRGEGGFGGERGPEAVAEAPPADELPSVEVEMTTSSTQALLYRWASGDPNPIHLEPTVAAQVGFSKPILHGLCTFGHAARAVVNGAGGGDARKLLEIEGRFSRPVLPGAALLTRLWSKDEGTLFETHADGQPVIVRGRATLARDSDERA